MVQFHMQARFLLGKVIVSQSFFTMHANLWEFYFDYILVISDCIGLFVKEQQVCNELAKAKTVKFLLKEFENH